MHRVAVPLLAILLAVTAGWRPAQVATVVDSAAPVLAARAVADTIGATRAGDGGRAAGRRAAAGEYVVTNLGTLPATARTNSRAADLNAAGEVVGRVEIFGSWESRGFLWRDGDMIDLGTLPETDITRAQAIDDAGRVVGVSGVFEGPGRPFLWEAGRLTDLDAPAGAQWVTANDINGNGEIAGTVGFASVQHQHLPSFAFVVRDRLMINLGTLGGLSSVANGINAAGQVVGGADTPGGARHAFVTTASPVSPGSAMTDLGTLPGHEASEAVAINGSGLVVGRSFPAAGDRGDYRAFAFADGVMTDLGALPGRRVSEALGVNAAGRIVGTSGQGSDARAFRYDVGTGVMVNLNTLLPAASGWVLTEATAINDLGQIVGSGLIGGETRAFLLTPAGSPEAAALAAGEADRLAAAEAAATAVELSRLEATGQFDALYDRMHPDAQAVVPRAAVVGWYANDWVRPGPGVSTVTGVRFVDWTWQVTGVTYPGTAEVTFEQPLADGSVAEDVVRLVRDDRGEWRWFFGRDRAFVEEQIAKYGGATQP